MKTTTKSIFTVIVALSCLTIAQAQDENPQARTEGKLKGKISSSGDNGMLSVSEENPETSTTIKGWDGTVKGNKKDVNNEPKPLKKGINEKGLKKNEPVSAENRGIEKANIKRSSNTVSNPMYKQNNVEGENPLYKGENDQGQNPLHGTLRKGIKENGLKKNHANSNTATPEKKGLNAVNVKLSKSNSEQSSDLIDDVNPAPLGHAVKTKGNSGTTETEVKPVKVEQIKIGQPHP